MSYRCQVCQKAVPPGVIQRRHVVQRPRSNGFLEIASETPVCFRCHQLLADGFSLAKVATMTREAPVVVPQPLAPEPPVILPPTYVESASITGTSDPIDF